VPFIISGEKQANILLLTCCIQEGDDPLPRAANPHRLRPTIAIRSSSAILFRIALHFQPCGVIHVWTAQPAAQKDHDDELLLLARLGLRAGDIMTLRIDDIDWQHGTLRVCGKSRRAENLPLPQDVVDAMLKYLTEARSAVPIAQVFLCSFATFFDFRRQ
jgi:hypothetical protein